MQQTLWRAQRTAIAIGLIDALTIGLGMGVPFFAVLFGLPVGWYYGGVAIRGQGSQRKTPPSEVLMLPLGTLRRPVGQAASLGLVTMFALAVIWLPQLTVVLDATQNASDWGIPLILFGSQASKIAWIVLMVVISPLLQFMAAVTGAVLHQVIAMRKPGTA